LGGGIEKGRTGRGIGHDVLDLRRAKLCQRKLGIVDPERQILDQDALVLDRAVA
jgi:hypothetical protein